MSQTAVSNSSTAPAAPRENTHDNMDPLAFLSTCRPAEPAPEPPTHVALLLEHTVAAAARPESAPLSAAAQAARVQTLESALERAPAPCDGLCTCCTLCSL